MFYLLTKIFLYFLVAVAWYYAFIFISLTRKIIYWCILCLLFVSRFIEHITGAREEAKPSEEVSQVSATSKDTKSTKGKLRPRASKANEEPEPTFSTKLSSPIEDIIEETLNEEKNSNNQSSSQLSETTVIKPKKKKKPRKKESTSIKSDEENCRDFIFLNHNQNTVKSQKSHSLEAKKTESINTTPENVVEDDIGISFFPVKEKSKKSKSKVLLENKKSAEALSTVISQGIAKKRDSSHPSIIEHFKPKEAQVSIVKKETSGTGNSIPSQELIADREVQTKVEIKESKKVTSKISYANIVTNSVPADFKFDNTQEEHTNLISIRYQNSEKGSSDSVELSKYHSINSKESAESYQDVKKYLVTENNDNYNDPNVLENSIESSVEVTQIPDYSEQKTDANSSHFEENILYYVKSSESSKDILNDNYFEDHFTQNQHAVNSDNSKGCPADQTLNNIIEELVSEDFDKLQVLVNQSCEVPVGCSSCFKNSESLQEEIVHKSLSGETFSSSLSHDADELGSKLDTWFSDISHNVLNTSENNFESDQVSRTVISNTLVENSVKKEGVFETEDLISSEIDGTRQSCSGQNTRSVIEIYTHAKITNSSTSEKELEVPKGQNQESETTKNLRSASFENEYKNLSVENFDDLLIKKSPSVDEIVTERLEAIEVSSRDQIQNIKGQIQIIDNQITKEKPTIAESEIIIPDNQKQAPLGSLSSEKIQKLDQTFENNFRGQESEIIVTDKILADHSKSHDILEKPESTVMAQVRVLTLNDKEHQESTIYRIKKSYKLQFRLGPSLLGRKIKLFCNYPQEVNGTLLEFDRGTYQLLSWRQDEGCKHADDTASFVQLVARVAGSFHYYFTYENEDTEERQGSGYFIVDPVLTYGKNEELPLDCIQCQTVLAKHLGPFSTWENKLRVTKESGYNMIHFTPIQELGASNSAYSLSEQLKLNPIFTDENGRKPSFEDVEALTSKMRTEWRILSICDIVLNHTANESQWIKDHPEATYNCVNCPYMRPAYLLDAAFHQFSMDIKKGCYDDCGIPAEVSTEDHLNAIRYHFKRSVLEPLKLHELFTVDVKKYLEEFLASARKNPPIDNGEREDLPELQIIQDPEFRRLKSSIDLDLALKKYNSYRLDCFDEESRVKKCSEDLKSKLDYMNETMIAEVRDDLNAAIENVIAGIRYFRVQADGPKFRDITTSQPLVYRYFTDYGTPKSLQDHEEIMYSENSKFLMAHNGWVIDADPLKNFADIGSKTYFRRELVAWGDSVKLRFGNQPEDSPFLWNYMRQYVEQTVKIFDGVRLDNCHSTPIPVAEYLLDCARKVRPDLYVVAELFTNSDLTDNIFVNRLGITSLIREAMSAWDPHEEGRLVYRYGGVPVGSFYQPNIRPLVPMVAHALFLDLTHDNPSPVEKRSVFDLLPSTALVNMACCASGSNRGYDELVPHHIHVVNETRLYTEWTDNELLTSGTARYVGSNSGIIAAKRALNELHFKLGMEGYDQVYVDQMDPDIVAVTRHNPNTHTSYVLVAFTSFQHPDVNAENHQRDIKPLRVEGVLDEIVLEASLTYQNDKFDGSKFSTFQNFTKDPNWINGLSEYQVSVKEHIDVSHSDIFEEVNSGNENVFQLNFKHFKPGSVAVVKISLPEDMQDAVSKIRDLIEAFSVKKGSELTQVISKMTLADLNRALYRCDQEERDEGNGFDAYNIPNFGTLVYCGLQGFMSLLDNIRPHNDLGHPFCGNLRDGNWMIEYFWRRLKVDEGTRELGQWIEENTKPLQRLPRYLIPCYFDVIVTGIYIQLLEQSYNLMSGFVKHGSTFVHSLSLGSVQFGAYIRSADLPVLSPNLAPPKPPTRKNKNNENIQVCVSLAAGLPHFSVGYMRNWGRDTFIALRGLFILTGRFEEARQHILAYAGCLRHGLIPNLLDGGRNPRYNCRDAVWWWLYCIKSYCEEAPHGTNILTDLVSRIFPTDDSPAQAPGTVDQLLQDVIQEALSIHFQGLKFRERNAGRQIDEHMVDAGFNNQIGIHPETGFVFGGNQWNCGTWMDKMGSSEKAGNKGKPATPRDGSAVELVGLSKAAISWLWKLNNEGKYPYDGVQRIHKNGSTTKWTFKEWADKIQDNFEKKFFIGSNPSSDELRPDLVNKKSIYKDSLGASQPWTDYQLRCNFPIAMVVAPEMFDPRNAWAALEQVEKYLLGPLGMKTLDPEDWNYRGDYDNSNDSDDFNTSHGFNYHQGPEWIWPIGFFLRAKLLFAAQNGMLKETLANTKVILSKHFTELQTSVWRGLPELTNKNGSYCRDSSRTQAWSMSCVLEVLYDLQQVESKQIAMN